MGIRGPTYIAISPEATPDIRACWLKAVSAEIRQDERGTLVLFEANLRPLWARFTAAPGLASTSDMEAEMEMVVWLGQIGSDHFRLARSEELLDIAGNWDASPFQTDQEFWRSREPSSKSSARTMPVPQPWPPPHRRPMLRHPTSTNHSAGETLRNPAKTRLTCPLP